MLIGADILFFFFEILQFTISRTPPEPLVTCVPKAKKGGLSAKPGNPAPGAPTGYAHTHTLPPPPAEDFPDSRCLWGREGRGDQNSSNTPRDP